MEYVTISRIFNVAEADMLAASLRAAGYDVLIHGESAARTTASVMSVGGIRIQVPSDQEVSAREFLKEYLREVESGSFETSPDDVGDPTDESSGKA
jgi:Ni,Fe-hydrogenase III large subunit